MYKKFNEYFDPYVFNKITSFINFWQSIVFDNKDTTVSWYQHCDDLHITYNVMFSNTICMLFLQVIYHP